MAEQKKEQLTLKDFIDWCRESVKLEALAALMSRYGYTRYDSDTIIEAINASPDFLTDFSALVRTSLAEDKSHAELARADGQLSASDWLTVAGTALSSVGTTITSVLTGKSTVTNTDAATASSLASKKASNTFLWIILVVIVLAVIGILWVSLSKKK